MMGASPLDVRAATRSDIPAISAIAHATWPVCYASIISPDQIAYMLDLMYGTPALEAQLGPKGHRFLIAERDGTPMGFAGFEHGHRPGRSRLHKLYVLPEVKGTGVGHALLVAVLAEAVKSGDVNIELNVNKRNTALAFYERHGFRILRDEVIDIGSGYVMDDFVMEREL